MPTARSSTDLATPAYATDTPAPRQPVRQPARQPSWHPEEVRRAVADVRHLVRFAVGTVRKPKVLRVAATVLALITAGAVLLPLLGSGAGAATGHAATFREVVLPQAVLGFLVLTAAGGIATGGGRQLLSGDQGSAYPISATTDFLGSVLLAPMSTGWLLQAWFLLGASAYAVGAGGVVAMTLLVALWIATATVIGQAVAWAVEHLRRGPHGPWLVRGLGALAALTVAVLQYLGVLVDVANVTGARALVEAGVAGLSLGWVGAVLFLLVVAAVALVAGGVAADAAARRLPRDEARAETRRHDARPTPRTSGAMLRRIDRASVWRSVAMRRGILVLATGPGVVALAGGLTWDNVVILPGLVVSGGVLLFGVNAWSLDGRGGLWRESLPIDPRAVFRARSQVMAEWLLLASLITIVLASVRAGAPTASEVAAVVVTVLVVTVQVVAVAMTWSVRRPYAVSAHSARATPAPPAVMVGYSAKLALSTTLTAMVFSTASWAASWQVVVLLALPFLAWSGRRWWRAERVWADPASRAVVVTTVAG